MNWKFRPGDIVRFREYDTLGVVVQLKLASEVDPDMGGTDPWYLITWVVSPEGEYHFGQEHEDTLVPVFRPVLIHRHENPNGFEL